MTLISAPAGFGKSTLAAEWIAGCGRPAAWLSLDAGDHEPDRFLVYFIRALRHISPDLGSGLLDELQSSGAPSIQAVLTALLNEITAIPHDFVLVLDDYHEIDARPVDEALAFLIDHLPPNMHLVLTTREDPSLPLSRLRARIQLIELRAADLRFTPSEAAEFLNQVMDLRLTADEVAALETRTEGWIAGLQLAALSMRGSQDVHGFIRAFAGDHRFIVDYLVEEVLQHQPAPVRNFLLQTSILERLHGPLCDAVTGQPGGMDRLETLLRGNFFVIPLDDRRQWYRYHHLFAEVLRTYLMAEQPEQLAELHHRASLWFEQHGTLGDAIRHALAAEDFPRAADLIERAFPEMSRNRQESVLLGWLKALPEGLVRTRPVLCNLYAGTLMQSGEMEGVEAWLQAAERWLTPARERDEPPDGLPPGMFVVDLEEFRRLPGWVAMHRAGQALMLGKVDESIQHARRVLDLAPDDDFLRRGGAAALQGLVFWARGDLEAARRIYPEGIQYLRRAGHLSDATGCALALADIVITQGRLREAMGIYEQTLRFASERGMADLRGTADMLVGMSELHYEWNDLRAATQCLSRAREQGEHTGLPQNRYRWRVAMARVREAEGDLNGALELLDEAESLYMTDFSPQVRPIGAMKARVYAAQGRLEEALNWAREQKLTTTDDLNYLREYEHITLARILLACFRHDREEGHLQGASALLDRLLEAAETGGRLKSAIEILILQALLFLARGNLPESLAPLGQALSLAEPEGCVRMFVDEGPPLREGLLEAAARGVHPAYTGRLLAAFEAHSPGQSGEAAALVPRESTAATAPNDTLVEPLSQRELDVLRLFRTELSGPEIARELVVALSTVRTHTKSIYGKLNVNTRRAAVKRATELGLM